MLNNVHPLPWRGAAHTLIRLSFVFLAVVATLAAGIGYRAVFEDEFDARNPVNLRRGAFAPMYRHRIEWALIQWAVFASVTAGMYGCFGKRMNVNVNWAFVRRFLFRLHLLSGILIVIGLLGAVIGRQPLHLRDAITVLVGFGLLFFAFVERFIGLHDDAPLQNTVF